LFFIRSVVYRELRGFDDDFFAHQEEIDLCWRAINKGYLIKYNYKSTVYHVWGATLQQGNPKKTFLNFRNSLLMLTKNVPKDNLYRILFSRMILDGIVGISLQGNFLIFQQFLKHTILLQFFQRYKKRAHFQKIKYYNIKSIV
jgi:GT2 family glycosyltransferase